MLSARAALRVHLVVETHKDALRERHNQIGREASTMVLDLQHEEGDRMTCA